MAIPVEDGYLYAIRQQAAFTWRKIVCELIDNSFDAAASSVKISWPGGNVFSIEDDGIGCDDLLRMVTIGQRRDYSSTSIGHFGVGAKYGMIWLWGRTHIESRCGHKSSEITADWQQIADSIVPYPDCQQPGTRKTPGTKITCYGDRRLPNFSQLIPDIGYTYTPAIEAGKKILAVTNRGKAGVLLVPRRWPKCSEEIDDSIEAAGRCVRIRMGIVDDGRENTYEHGFSFERDYRVILESAIGANGFATSRLAARITLGPEWMLSTNKDDFTEYKEEIGEAIYDRCAELMERTSEQALTIEDQQFNAALAAMVSEAAKNRREKREPTKESVGTVEPKDTGRRRENASETSDMPGSIANDTAGSQRRRRSGFTVETYTESSGSKKFGYYDADGNRVRLNYGNEWLKEKHSARNIDAVLPVIYGILAFHSHKDHNDRMPLFVESFDDFSTQWGSAVAFASLQGAAT